MRNLKFHRVSAQNILCFGTKGIEINFSNFGNIIQVRGVNLDAPGTESDPASNGSGKSSIQEVLSIALFGRTVKSPTKNKGNRIVNVLADKGEIEIEWDDFKVVRSFKKSKSGSVTSKLDLWQSNSRVWNDDSKISFGTSDETQKFIEEQIGLTHHAFCNVVIFDDSNTYSFLESDAATKRQIVENLLDLDQYRDYHENCKSIIKELKKNIADKSKEYSTILQEQSIAKNRLTKVTDQLASWKTNKQIELKNLFEKIKLKQEKLVETDTGDQLANWQKGQDRIQHLIDEISDLESKRDKIQEILKIAREKIDLVRKEKNVLNEEIQVSSISVKSVEMDLSKALKLIRELENLKEGTLCPVCYGAINMDNFGHVLDHGKDTVAKCRTSIDQKIDLINETKETFGKKAASLSIIEEKVSEAEGKISIIEGTIRKHRREITELTNIPKPEGNISEHIIESEILELKKQFKSKREEFEGDSPYKEIIEDIELEITNIELNLANKEKELKESESEIPYFEYWSEAFGDNGIRKFVIDGIIPALNDRISYWLQILIDGLIELKFDNKLEETITRNGNPAFYHNMSNGEMRRVNLAVSQSFAYVMMLNSGCCPSLVFLDEITGGGIDRAGVPYVYNMIFELAKERQVFVTTHNDVLMNLLDGCETLTLKKYKDVSELLL
jgi:DNA repair exonuclease SbcCD ATPase subunit